MYNFLEGSPHRHAKLQAIIKQINSKPHIKSIKTLPDTRWACKSDAIIAVFEKFSAITQALDEIEESSYNGRIASEASRLRDKMLKLEFLKLICMLVV